MPARFTYRRLTASEFAAELERQNLSAPSFARIFGVNIQTVKKWHDGVLDIPPWVPIAMTLMSMDGALGRARFAAADFIWKDNLRPDLGEYPYKSLRDLPADAEQGD